MENTLISILTKLKKESEKEKYLIYIRFKEIDIAVIYKYEIDKLLSILSYDIMNREAVYTVYRDYNMLVINVF